MAGLTDILTPAAGLPADCVAVSVVVPNARSLPADESADATRRAYDELRDQAVAAGAPHLLRVWNYIPALLDPTDNVHNRYMAFNAGRYSAMHAWFGDDLPIRAPAGTGVGNPGDDLIVHAWAAAEPGVAVQNPRQTPATGYSTRYGPRPPCFARATRVGGLLLVSGTAAITGEDTVSPDDLPKQLELTLSHLATLAGGMAKYQSLRAYVPRTIDLAFVRARLASGAPHLGDVNVFVTDLCRPELRVEIEGVAAESGTR